jgi:DNA (cytosine-5)-methyltransferase 1
VLPEWRPVAPYIDFGDMGESIYRRKRPLARATMERIGAGIERFVRHRPYVVDGNATFITQFNHNCVGQSMREPMRTITCSPGHFGLVTAFLVSYYGNSHGAQSVGEPRPTITTRDRFGLVTCEVDGETYQVADVHLRMLKPEELKRAQGFDASYVIDHYPDGRRVTRSEQTAKIGNSVCPPMAEKIVAANIA